MLLKRNLLIVSLAFSSLFLSACKEDIKERKNPNILVIGDSLSASYQLPIEKGWVKLMSNELLDQGLNHKIINNSVSGATTGDALKSIESGGYYDIDILVLAIGANDALQRLDPQSSYSNIVNIIRNIESKSSPKILLINLEPPKKLGVFGLGMFQYRKIYTQIKDQNESYYYIDNLMQNLDNTHFLPDMIHPNSQGQIIMKNNVVPIIKKIIEKNHTH